MLAKPRHLVLLLLLLVGLAAPSAAQGEEWWQARNAHQEWQNGQCGRGATWICNNKYFIPASCFWNSNGGNAGYWDCSGVIEQYSLNPFTAMRRCQLYSHRRNDAFFFQRNWCYT